MYVNKFTWYALQDYDTWHVFATENLRKLLEIYAVVVFLESSQ